MEPAEDMDSEDMDAEDVNEDGEANFDRRGLFYRNFRVAYKNSLIHADLNGIDFSVSLVELCITGFKGLKVINSHTLQHLVNLEWLDLSDNAIAEIEPGTLSPFKKLKHCDLSGNKLRTCPSIQGLNNLQRLNLHTNLIESIDGLFTEPNFSPYNKLLNLDLYENSIKSLSSKCFSSFSALRYLNLGNNKTLDEISNEAFFGLVNLQVLNLCGLNLNVISSSFFASVTGLRLLYLNDCGIKKIEAGAFGCFSHKVEVVMNKERNCELIRPFEELIQLYYQH
jgi:hypothetical protein